MGVLVSFGLETAVFRGFRAQQAATETLTVCEHGWRICASRATRLLRSLPWGPRLGRGGVSPWTPVGGGLLGRRRWQQPPSCRWRSSALKSDSGILAGHRHPGRGNAGAYLPLGGSGPGVTGWMLAYALGGVALLVRGLAMLSLPWSVASTGG